MSTEDKSYSKAEMAGMVQASLSLCATCAHARGEHEGDRSCQAQWETGDKENRMKHSCGCAEFWEMRHQREDGVLVVGYEVGFGGAVGLTLDRRVPTEFWESLGATRMVEVRLQAEVTSKGFKRHKDGGLIELRKLVVTDVRLAELDEETGDLR